MGKIFNNLEGRKKHQKIGFIIGVVLFLIMQFLPTPSG